MLVAMYISLSVPMLCYACIKMTLRPMQLAVPRVRRAFEYSEYFCRVQYLTCWLQKSGAEGPGRVSCAWRTPNKHQPTRAHCCLVVLVALACPPVIDRCPRRRRRLKRRRRPPQRRPLPTLPPSTPACWSPSHRGLARKVHSEAGAHTPLCLCLQAIEVAATIPSTRLSFIFIAGPPHGPAAVEKVQEEQQGQGEGLRVEYTS